MVQIALRRSNARMPEELRDRDRASSSAKCSDCIGVTKRVRTDILPDDTGFGDRPIDNIPYCPSGESMSAPAAYPPVMCSKQWSFRTQVPADGGVAVSKNVSDLVPNRNETVLAALALTNVQRSEAVLVLHDILNVERNNFTHPEASTEHDR